MSSTVVIHNCHDFISVQSVLVVLLVALVGCLGNGAALTARYLRIILATLINGQALPQVRRRLEERRAALDPIVPLVHLNVQVAEQVRATMNALVD